MTIMTIDSIAAGGEGVGRLPDGRVAFVSRTSPGDVVEVVEVDKKPRYVRARVISLKSPGPDRVDPACVHYTRDGCGGCQLQHLAPQAQRHAKRHVVGDALRRIAGLSIDDPEIVASDDAWRYRSKITLTARTTRQGRRVFGLHRYAAPGVFEPSDCMITRERVMALWGRVRDHETFFPRNAESVTLREDRDGGHHVVFAGGTPPWDPHPLVQAVGDRELSYWWRPAGGAARVVAGPRTGFPALAFEQSNPALADTIRRDAVSALGDIDGAVVWDLYGGVGDTAALLASRGATAWSVDTDRAAKEWAGTRTPESVRHVTGRVEAVLCQLDEPVAVVVNPPRAGLARRVARHLNRWGAASSGRMLAYISCDPATLARDVSRLTAFSVQRVVAYDLFPQTSHVETLVVMDSSA
ncbi:MAG: class I SAM-dependent RNA methyltransferase [Gemmatimonadales bacterium]